MPDVDAVVEIVVVLDGQRESYRFLLTTDEKEHLRRQLLERVEGEGGKYFLHVRSGVSEHFLPMGKIASVEIGPP